MNKKCKVCGEVKDLSEFNRNHKYLDGHLHMCKECRKIQNSRYYRKHSEQVNQTDDDRAWAMIRECNAALAAANTWVANKLASGQTDTSSPGQ